MQRAWRAALIEASAVNSCTFFRFNIKTRGSTADSTKKAMHRVVIGVYLPPVQELFQTWFKLHSNGSGGLKPEPKHCSTAYLQQAVRLMNCSSDPGCAPCTLLNISGQNQGEISFVVHFSNLLRRQQNLWRCKSCPRVSRLM